MPAKKKQTQQQQQVPHSNDAGAAEAHEQAELAKMAALMQEALAAQGPSKQSKKLQDRDVRKFMEEYRAQQMQYYREQAMQQEVQRFNINQELLVANRTQYPVNNVALESAYTKWSEIAPGKWVRYEQFTPAYMEQVMKMFADELPEPYSVFTYEHFLSGWPSLGILLFGASGATAPETPTAGGELIGAIVSRVTWNAKGMNFRGYIAMLAVRAAWRGHRLGQRLVKVTVEVMKKLRASEVVLETPVSNERALKLYTDMGFAKTKFLTRYYLDGSDAYRLKLWFAVPQE
jgi:peptide alpha-N-acetyltransferase